VRRWEPSRRRWQLLVGVVAVVLAVVIGVLARGGRSPVRHPPPPPTATPTTTPPVQPPAPVAPAPIGPPARPAPRGEQFGANVNRLFNDRAYTPRQIDAQLSALRATGAAIARTDALWEITERTPPTGGVHHYDWTFDDSIAGSLAAHGLRWLPIVDYSASWVQSLPGARHPPPSSASEYASFAAALAGRYGSGGAFWRAHPGLRAKPVSTYEIWNEPDNPSFWSGGPSAGTYDELYVRARDAIATVDPSARVIVGGLTNPVAFLPAMLTARPDLRGHIDGVAIHPYAPNPGAVLGQVHTARRVLSGLGLSTVPLYITELGWTIHPTGALNWLSERLRPGYIELTIAALGHVDCGLAATILYTWVTPERNPTDREDWFGIHSPSGASTPDSVAFAAGLRRATQASAPIRVCAGS
jgi:hypothetical protein